MKKAILLATSLLVVPVSVEATMLEDNTCMTGPLAEFGRYVGNWDIQDWSLSKDGTTWTEGKAGTTWDFVCLEGGTAVQDFWHPAAGGYGTNLRTYNTETKSWDIVWTAKSLNGFTRINAVKDDDGNMVMSYISPQQNPPRRITFMKPTEDGWDWKLEMSFDGEQSWVPVYKIKATKSAP